MSSAFAVAALLGITSSANATLLSYEGFNYPGLSDGQSAFILPGTPNNGLGTAANAIGSGDSFGWAAGWSTSAGTNQYVASGLTYSGLQTDGGALRVGVVHGTTSPATTAQLQRANGLFGASGASNTLGSIAAANGGTLWLSFLYQNQVNDPLGVAGLPGYASAYLAFIANGTAQDLQGDGSSARAGTDIFGVGGGNSSSAGVPAGLIMGNIGANAGVLLVDSGATNVWGPTSAAYLIVLRLDIDQTSAADTITLWENPTGLGSAPIGTSFTMATNISSVNSLRFQSGNNNGTRTNSVMEVDEIRLGTTFADVTPPVPEPSIIALAGVALSGMFLAIRRKR